MSATGVWRRQRTLIVTAGVAVVSLAAGVVAGQFIRSPADAASRAEPPEASVITVPVERRELNSEVVTRGDVAFAGSTEVALELGGLATPPVVTGHVPERGDELAEGEPLLEVVGRPVIALAGELPMYRSLSPGMSGPDVVQLEETLGRLGYDPGTRDDRYTAATGWAVARLFEDAGYEPPEPAEDAVAELEAAQDAVDAAEAELAAAEEAQTGVERAEDALAQAQDELDEAQWRAGTPLPIAEVYYLPTLPRQVDDVQLSRGDLAEGTVMAVSSADLQVTARINEADRELVAVEMAAVLDLPTGTARGTISGIRPAEGEDATGFEALIAPPELDPAQVEELRSSNIRVTIPVGSTEGEVLAVPLAALTAGPGGESRVERWRGDERELVEVEVGLVAQGYAEVTATDGSLSDGDQVAVGEAAEDQGDGEQDDPAEEA